MFSVPVTYFFDFIPHAPDRMRRYVMEEFAANGAKHLVLTDQLISAILENFWFADVLREEMQSAGLTFVDAHAPFGDGIDLNVRDPQQRELLLARHLTSMRIAADMGVNTITIHVGNNSRFKNYPLEEHMDCIRRSLAALLPTAEKIGMTVCIENIWFPMNQPAQLLALKEAFPTDALGFCYDAGHANLMAHGPDEKSYVSGNWAPMGFTPDQIPWDKEILEKMLPYVVNCHLHDNDGTEDQHRNVGRGNVDWKHVVGLLKKAPRLKCIQSEVLAVRTMDSIRSICQAFDRLGEL